MNKVAEQDSLEQLIARLRNGARFDDRIEAAVTLSQMRDALEEARNFADYLDPCPAKYELIDMIDAALTTTKIEKDQVR